MNLRHYTSPWHIAGIAAHGLTRGDVPTSPTGGFNAVWFTDDASDPEGDAHGLNDFKTAYRLTVTIPDGALDRLCRWTDLCDALDVAPAWAAILNDLGGGKADTWYVFRGVVPVDWITRVERRGPDGVYVDAALSSIDEDEDEDAVPVP